MGTALSPKGKRVLYLAITDHGAMYGALEFYKACKAGGIHPLLGVEAYLTEDMAALYQPGPMDSIPDFIDAKHGRKKVTYLDPRLSEWLAES